MHETAGSGGVKVERRDEPVELWTPRLGRVTARRRWVVEADEPERTTRWHVVERDGAPPLVLEEWHGAVRGWTAARGRAWEAPPWLGALEERLGSSPTPARARAVLLAGVAPAWPLFETSEEVEDEPDDDQPPPSPWTGCPLDPAAADLAASAHRLAAAAAEALGLDLVAASPARPLSAACRWGSGYSWGVPVIGWSALRVASEVRFAGAPALLVAETTAFDDHPYELDRPSMRVVPFTAAIDVERVVLEEAPGFPLVVPARAAPGR
jgi:hypothetical protein